MSDDLKSGGSNLTAQQQAAVTGQGNLLVVAGAGTGKTRTLIARCLRLVREDRVSLESILMVTFTEAAAAEMRSRIRIALQEWQRAEPEDEFPVQQLALLDTARISTLHSFCLQLVREHFHELSLDPQFNVLDEPQTRPLMSATLDALLERHYGGTDARARSVQALIRATGRGADWRIRKLLTRLHRYSQSLPDPSAWLDEQERRSSRSEPEEWRQWFDAAVNDWCAEWRELVGAYAGQAPATDLCHAALRGAADSASVVRAIAAADAKAANWPRGSRGRVRDPLRRFFAEAEFLASLLPGEQGNDPLAQDWQWSREHMATLLMLTREFTAAFTRAKREQGGLDFADLEQCALELLRDPAIASHWRSRLTHLFVDEYQDINEAQDRIITTLSRTSGNRFLVGDVKQSIYRFRLANPGIFGGYDRRWASGGEGQRIPLTENFRSRAGLLEFINPLFGGLMRREIGGVDYEPLQFGAAEERSALAMKAGDSPRVELHVIARADREAVAEESDEEQGGGGRAVTDLLAVEREARLIARRLLELKSGGHLVWDERERRLRPVQWGDMTVLLRSPKGRAEAFAMEFSRAGVPLVAARDGFFESIEVSDLLSLLQLLDNPLQDIPLLAVLRSPIGGFSLDELAVVRAHGQEKPFWRALSRFHEDAKGRMGSNDGLEPAAWRKTDQLRQRISRWRELARKTSLSQCLETALIETDYETLLLAGERGEERLANVRRLADLARQFDPYQRQGLYRFLRFVVTQADEELDLQPGAPPAVDAVRLMSIHKSKGLEFPVVALAGLGSSFNQQDLSEPVLLSERFGLCPKITPPGQDQSYPGLAHWLARRAEQRELRGEELRLLYVALTRARDTLVLVGSSPRKLETVKWEARPGAVGTAEVASARSHLDWLLAWLRRATAAEEWRDDQQGENRLVRWHIHRATDAVFAELPEPTVQMPPRTVIDDAPGVLAALEAKLQWQYPFASATVEAAKTTVSALRRRQVEADGDEARPLFHFRPARLPRRNNGLSAVEKGNAHHRFLELARLDSLPGPEGIRAEAERLQAEGYLSPGQRAALDFEALGAFWRSDIGASILKHRDSVQREVPFTARFSMEDLRQCGLEVNLPADDFVVVQGIVDLAVVLPGELRIIDFKTDEVSASELPAKAEFYAPQLKLYALALSRIYRRPVTECGLYFLACRRMVPVALVQQRVPA